METQASGTGSGLPTAATDEAKQAMAQRIETLKFYDIVQMAKRANGGRPLGMDPNRAFSGAGSKPRFAAWCVANFTLEALNLALRGLTAQNGRLPTNTPPQTAQGQTPQITRAHPIPRDNIIEAEAAQVVVTLGGSPRPTVPQPPRAAEPAAMPAAVDPNEAAADLAAVLGRLMAGQRQQVNPEQVRAICQEELARIGAMPTRVEVVTRTGDSEQTADLGVQHKLFPDLVRMLQVRGANGQVFPIWMPGPAGSGKTTAAMNAARALSLPFFHNGALMNKFELLGFRDATGQYAPTEFYKAYKDGGLYLWDEVDASAPESLVALNAAIENGHCAFPDGTVPMHKDFLLVAAANTYGAGATHDYVGRNKLDAATVDRFVMLPWDYDEALEIAISGNAQWASIVHRIRAAVAGLGIKHVVSPRASIRGAAYIAAGFTQAQALNMTVRKGLSDDQWRNVMDRAGVR